MSVNHETIMMGKKIHLEPISRRIKIYQLPNENPELSPAGFIELAEEKKCDKLIFYVNEQNKHSIKEKGALFEGEIKGFLNGDDASIFSIFLDRQREQSISEGEKKLLDLVKQKQHKDGEICLPKGYQMRIPNADDTLSLTRLYSTIFETYPTPMNDPNFVKKLILDDTVYFTVVEYEGEIVSACSADVMTIFNCAELSDCATLDQHRKKGLLSFQFDFLIQQMREQGIHTVFTYSRSSSLGMNMINARYGFSFGGCMIQNSNIGGDLENMNIWYKELQYRGG